MSFANAHPSVSIDDIDDDTIDYLQGILCDNNIALSEKISSVVPFLLDSDVTDEPDIATEIITQFVGTGTPGKGGGGGGGGVSVLSSALPRLAVAVDMEAEASAAAASTTWELDALREDRDSIVDGSKVAAEKARQKASRAKRDAKAARMGKKLAAERLALQALENEEMERASRLAAAACTVTTRDIRVDRASIRLGSKLLLDDQSFSLHYGRRYGLVGRNGAGKTTLMKHIALRKFDGIERGLQILHVAQEAPACNETAVEYVLQVDAERTELLAQVAVLQAKTDSKSATRLAQVYERLQDIDADGAEAKARQIMSGLEFTEEMQDTPVKFLSGGWRMRVALVRALYAEDSCDVLCLDEPLNNLSLVAQLWLERYLLSWKGTILLVAHNRSFLNAICTDILWLAQGQLQHFKGDYDTYERTRAERDAQHESAAKAGERKRAHVEAFVKRFRYNANRAALVQSRLKLLDKMVVLSDTVSDPILRFAGFENPDDLDALQGTIMELKDVSFAYREEGPTILRNVNLTLEMSSRVCVLGANGEGKTTLMKLLIGDLVPTTGSIQRNARVRLGLFTQYFVDQLDLSTSASRFFQSIFPGMEEQDARRALGAFGIAGDLATRPMNTLSGGQKSRVALAKLAQSKFHGLLLDEPTNNLDIESVDALASALSEWRGALIIVSHDQRFIELVADQLVTVQGGAVQAYTEDFQHYRDAMMKALK
eukprot:CAMPEP_0170739114 /NCGR_PEP_ID=MMETSP0437-20130122/4993_1 /TAXON_ID=0 /ORGANISM="Sexangularia sp." /LENGTH=714 /DNA_ID=CAMNT_0011077557 /DNA_START=63 /DNA_END=2207 /DNA_ORIENTATION=-